MSTSDAKVDEPRDRPRAPRKKKARVLVTQAEYARRRGISRQAVNKAIAVGRLTAIGKLIDLSTADQEWWDQTDVSQLRLIPEADSPAVAPKGAGKSKSNGVTRGVASPAPATTTAADPSAPKLNPERARRESAMADLAKLDLEERLARLTSVDGVRREQFDFARIVRDRLLNMPAELAPRLSPGSSAAEVECRMLLEEYVNQLCGELADLAAAES